MLGIATWQLIAVILAFAGTARAVAAESEPTPRTIELERLWTIGGESEAEGEVFGLVADLAVDPAGRLLVLDSQLSVLRVFSPDGEYLRAIGRPGEGPGDLSSAMAVSALGDGSLCVLQGGLGRCSRFNPDGAYLGELALPDTLHSGARRLTRLRAAGSLLAVEGVQVKPGEDGYESRTALFTVSADGIPHAIAESSRRFSLSEMVVRELGTRPFRWTLAPDGRLFLVRDFGDEIEVWSRGGVLAQRIDCGFAHRQRSAEEKEAVREYFRRGGGTKGIDIEVMDYEPDIAWLGVDGGGRLWVLSSQGRDAGAAGSLGVFAVFDPKGRFAGHFELRGEGELGRDSFYLIGDHLYVVTDAAAAFRSAQSQRQRGKADDAISAEAADEEALPLGIICYRLPTEAFR